MGRASVWQKIHPALINPGCLGIFGVDSSHLSATLILNYFFPAKAIAERLLRGSVAPENGMENLLKNSKNI